MHKAVVTGGAGFIGSHLIDFLVQKEVPEIVIIDNLFRGRLDYLAPHLNRPNVRFVEADIRDFAALNPLCADADVIFHLAAQSNVMGAVDDVDYSFSTNVAGTINVLKAAQANQRCRVIFTSSREIYGEAQYLPVDELHPMGSKNTYGASKAAGELYCNVFYNNFGVETAILRLSNVFGPRDFGRVIPFWLGWAAEGQDLIVYGGQQVIDFVWVGDVVDALWRAATIAELPHKPINIGSGIGTPILTLAERILALFDTTSKLDQQPPRSVEVVKFVADVQRMETELGLKPAADPLASLAKMVPLTV